MTCGALSSANKALKGGDEIECQGRRIARPREGCRRGLTLDEPRPLRAELRRIRSRKRRASYPPITPAIANAHGSRRGDVPVRVVAPPRKLLERSDGGQNACGLAILRTKSTQIEGNETRCRESQEPLKKGRAPKSCLTKDSQCSLPHHTGSTPCIPPL